MNKILASLLITTLFLPNVFCQKFSLGDKLSPSEIEFKLLGISSTTKVATYKYIGKITDKYFFNRQVDDIIVGIKYGIVVTTIYNLIPEKEDIGVPKSLVDLIQATLPFPLAYRDGLWGVIIDNERITLSRDNNPLTFKKDRIMFMSTVKTSLLSND
ncbi:MAG: hypothetical protein V9E96_09770 [Chitinophagaceae bacterium]|jgi:hypothetical protein